jgi:immune inhibitor A
MHLPRRVAVLCLLGAFALASCGVNTHPPLTSFPTPDLTPPAGLSGPALDAWRITHLPRPANNRADVAQRLFGATPTNKSSNAPSLNRHVGDRDTFWIPTQNGGQTQITAQIVYITPHAYAYVMNGVTLDLKSLRSSVDLFENALTFIDRRFFGNEPSPGVDNDVHITLLNVAGLPDGTAGLFSPDDEYPLGTVPMGNGREMIYLNVGQEQLQPATDAYNEALANAFAQMIDWYHRPNDPAWMREGLGMLAQHINGLSTDDNDSIYLAHTDTSLTNWERGNAALAHEGAGYLFLDYFAEHYGGFSILHDLLADPAPVPQNFDDVLKLHGYREHFTDVIDQWIMTNALIYEPFNTDPIYTYHTVSKIQALPQQKISALPYNYIGTIHQYAAQYIDLRASPAVNGKVTITFDGVPTVPLLNIAPSGRSFWWSNNDDNQDTTLTRSFDLSHLTDKTATLTFQVWYNLTPDEDFGAIEVSTDNGKTWHPQPINGLNNNEARQDHLFTNTNGSGWANASVDLSPFVGHSILVRFEMVTGMDSTSQGIALANISVPEIGLIDIAQTDSGWNSQGWLSVANTLPEQYSVQIALFNKDGIFYHVSDIPIDTNGHGEFTISNLGGDVSRGLLSVSALAPATAQDASYTLTVRAG